MQGKIGVAVIGLGRIGESHLDGPRQDSDKAFIAAVVDIDESRAKYTAQMQEFLNAISQRREPIVTYSQILTQLAIIDAAKQSAATHQPVTLKI